MDKSNPGTNVSRLDNDTDGGCAIFYGYQQMHSVGIIATQSLHYILAANSQPREAPVVHTCVCTLPVFLPAVNSKKRARLSFNLIFF
jgi:hypothetical protein